jgi:hypothetical protein
MARDEINFLSSEGIYNRSFAMCNRLSGEKDFIHANQLMQMIV